MFSCRYIILSPITKRKVYTEGWTDVKQPFRKLAKDF